MTSALQNIVIMAPNTCSLSDDKADRARLMGTPSGSLSTAEDDVKSDITYQSNDTFAVHVEDMDDKSSRNITFVETKHPYLSDISVSKNPKSKKAKFCFSCTIVLILALVGVTVTGTVEILLKSHQPENEMTMDKDNMSGTDEMRLNITSTIYNIPKNQSILHRESLVDGKIDSRILKGSMDTDDEINEDSVI